MAHQPLKINFGKLCLRPPQHRRTAKLRQFIKWEQRQRQRAYNMFENLQGPDTLHTSEIIFAYIFPDFLPWNKMFFNWFFFTASGTMTTINNSVYTYLCIMTHDLLFVISFIQYKLNKIPYNYYVYCNVYCRKNNQIAPYLTCAVESSS
jgi:hypothetical protein